MTKVENEFSELLTESEDEDEEAYVEYDIATYPSDYTLEVLRGMYKAGDIIIPPYQRKFVWDIQQASLLVESFLMGLPVPPIFLYVNEDNKLEVIDGQQRLRSMVYFMEGYFGEADSKGTRKVFTLFKLSEKSPYNKKSFQTLDERAQRKIRGAVLRAINIRQLNPNPSSTSVFHIFERLNTGGTTLLPQEIRNAVFRGKITNSLIEMNMDQNWRKILGSDEPDKHQRDVELVLRLLSLFDSWQQYEKPMKEHLNKYMKANRDFATEKIKNFERRFPEVCEIVVSAGIKDLFRPQGQLNRSLLEGIMLFLLENSNRSVENLREAYAGLIRNTDFMTTCRSSTTDTLVLRNRNRMVKMGFDGGAL